MAGFTNRDRLRRRMKAIPQKVREAVQAQNAVNAAELVEMQKRFAPVDDGALRASIRHEDTSDETRIRQTVSAGDRDAFYAAWVEFGTSKSPARPFFWPAYRLMRRRMRTRLARAAKKAVAEALT